MNRRNFLNLLLGSATVVGFETTFGLSRWRGFEPPLPEVWTTQKGYKSGDIIDVRLGAMNYIPPGRWRVMVVGG